MYLSTSSPPVEAGGSKSSLRVFPSTASNVTFEGGSLGCGSGTTYGVSATDGGPTGNDEATRKNQVIGRPQNATLLSQACVHRVPTTLRKETVPSRYTEKQGMERATTCLPYKRSFYKTRRTCIHIARLAVVV